MAPPVRQPFDDGICAALAEPSGGEARDAAAGCSSHAEEGDCVSCGRGGSKIQAKASGIAAERPPLRVVFMGTPDFAATILNRLLETSHVSIAAVYTQPDRPSGRGRKLVPPPVKSLALERGLSVLQPAHFRTDPDGDAAFAFLQGVSPDVLVVAAYGMILPRRVLDIPRLMPVNVHASLLPKYRGAAPIQRAVMAGDTVTGVTIMRMEASLDAGPILMQRAVGIDINDTSGMLHDELAREGAELLVQALERLSAGALAAMPQNDELATYAPKIVKAEGLVDFTLSPAALHARIRGLTPKPGAFMYLHRQGHEPLAVRVEPGIFPLGRAMKEMADSYLSYRVMKNPSRSTILGVVDNALLLTAGHGCYAFSRLKPAGKNVMDGLAFYNGYLNGVPGAFFAGPDGT